MPQVRLQKILSHAGIASRRLSEELITQGRVSVNGRMVTELGSKADPETDEIKVDGRRLKAAPERRHLLMYKPRGVMSTRSDPQKRTTVIDLLAKLGIAGYFYPVGRLDYDSEGLIILTNDGEFAEKVMHPRYELERVYEARVRGVPDDHDIERLQKGVVIEGTKTLPAKVKLVKVVDAESGQQGVLELVLREGRNRQARHMCDAIGHPVVRLCRTRIATLTARNLRPGDARDLTPGEVKMLSAAVPASGSRSAPAPRRRRSRPTPRRPRAT
jgi:23S rRNA pseudouridine2605 synthase